MNKTLTALLLLTLLSLSVSACQSDWQIEVTENGNAIGHIDNKDFSFYKDLTDEESDTILLGQMLYINGFTLIDKITLIGKDNVETTYVWEDIALETTLSSSGIVIVGSENYHPLSIDVKSSELTSKIKYSITDITPTMAYVLGLPALPKASGEICVEGNADHGVMILLDGFQFQKLQSLIESGKLPFLSSINGEIHRGLTVYPPVTVAASAALLTGTGPQINGVYGHGFRSTEITTLFDLVAEEGKTVIAVEGASLPFNLRNAEITISGDQDGNGFSDDNVLINSLDVILHEMPDLLYIHFHEIDDMGHSFGPDSEEYNAAAVRVDSYLAQIYDALPSRTVIAIFADHGMHAETNGGNHGNLIENDLVIPIIFLEK